MKGFFKGSLFYVNGCVLWVKRVSVKASFKGSVL